MRRFALLVWLVCLPLVGKAQHALSYTHLVVFGDNYSDTLNTYNATYTSTSGYDSQGDPYTYTDAYPSSAYGYQDGQFTNGTSDAIGSTTQFSGVWHQQLHGLLPGVPLAAAPLYSGQSTANNTNYAWGSATTGSGTTTVTFAGHLTVAVHNLNQQITDYLNAGYTPDAKSLYVLFGGLDDLLADSSTASATAAAANVTAEAKRLIDAGAVNVLVANVPGISANASSPIDVAAGVFAQQLAMDLAGLQAAYVLKGTPVKLTMLDLHTLYANIFAKPANFGFTDVMDKAMSSGTGGGAVANVDQYLNWDGVNPTTAGHHQIALAACTALTGTVTTLTASTATPTYAQPGTLTATVSASGTYGPQSSLTPTGTVTFYYPQTVLVTTTQVALGTATLANGQGSVTTTGLPVGVYGVYAVYSGDGNFATGCNSNVVTEQVAAAASSFDFSYSPTAAYVGMEEGQPVVLTPSAIGGYTGTVTFSCGTLPKFFSCTFNSSATVPITGVSNLFISSGTPTKAQRTNSGVGVALLFAGPLALLGWRRKKLAGLLVVLVVAGGLVGMSGCVPGLPNIASLTTTTSTFTDTGYGTTHGPGITYAAPGTYAIPIIATGGGISVTHTYYFYVADTFDVGVIP
jgi:phospholipase/lecithinase/hemolysin